MGNIIYRHYQRGDEYQLTVLFMKDFQMNGKSLIRTQRSLTWRHMDSPQFEPEMVQIAEDKVEKKIVGAVYVNPVEKILIKGKEYLVGNINDVSCHPDYTKRGIATNLMKKAIEYMEQKGCELAFLITGSDSIARNRIYLKKGFHDFTNLKIYINFPNLFNLFKNVTFLLPLAPLIALISFIPRIILNFNVKFNSFFRDVNFEITHGEKHHQYKKEINSLMPKYYEFFSKYSKQKLNWARINVPYKREIPSYVFVKKRKKIICGASITHEYVYISKFNFKLKIGIIHEIFLSQEIISNKKLGSLTLTYLIDKIMKAAISRNLGILLYYGDFKDHFLSRGFSKLGFLKLKGSVFMVKILEKKNNSMKMRKPIFIPTYSSLGYP